MGNFVKHAGLYTDMYQLAMAQAYYLDGRKDVPAVFYYFYRKNPFKGSYLIFAGLPDLMEALDNFHFDTEDLAYLQEKGFDRRFLKYLESFRFRGDIFSVREGEVVFPGMPILNVHGNIIEAQLAETILLNLLNFQSLVATKATRMRLEAGEEKILAEFGMRRAHSFSAFHASRAAVVGGFDSTSNVQSAFEYDLKASGTMAHSFVQSYDSELTAFRKFAEFRPKNCVLLVDTYDTLKSGMPNAIRVAKEMEQRGEKLMGIRIDSGDLAYMSAHARKMLDEAGLGYVKIVASNQLDEYLIRSLLEQDAPIDIFGVGTALVTGHPDAALDGVYKLCMADNRPRLKLSESVSKVTLPGTNQVYRFSADNGDFVADAIATTEEDPTMISEIYHPFEKANSMKLHNLKPEPLLLKVMEDGKASGPGQHPAESWKYAKERLKRLPDEYKRLEYPHIYKVGLSNTVNKQRDELINSYKERNI